VLGAFLGIRQQFLGQALVVLAREAARAGAGNRPERDGFAFEPADVVPGPRAPGDDAIELVADRSPRDVVEEGQDAVRAEARDACRADIPSPHLRDLTVTTDLVDETWRPILVPAWVGVFPLHDRVHVVVVHGRTGEVAGARPVDWRKVKAAMVLLLAPGGALVVLGLPLLPVLAVGVPVMLFGLLLLALGGVVSAVVWSSALASESA
jgi:hypothetical protein